MKQHGKEFLVGCLVLFAAGLMVIFGWLMGVVGPFTRHVMFDLRYSFAGGVEVGSPVRVSGIKVGKVESIDFLPQAESGKDAGTVKVLISVSAKASPAVREDSRFFINMAGIIGERYIEISPGSEAAPPLKAGMVVRGVDPPRIDQLLSQGYGVFGRIQEFLEENEKTVTEFLSNTTKLLGEANKVLKAGDKQRFFALIENLALMTDDMKRLTRRLVTDDAEETYGQIRDLIRRAHSVDRDALKKFFQDEGIRAKIF